jgi:hypothetical protein
VACFAPGGRASCASWAGKRRCAPTPGFFARVAHDGHICCTIGAKRIAPPWRLLAGIGEDDWHDEIDMDGAQVAEQGNCGYVRIVRALWSAWASLAERIA